MEAAALARISGVPFEMVWRLREAAPQVVEALWSRLRRGESVPLPVTLAR